MKKPIIIILISVCFSSVHSQIKKAADPSDYLDNIKVELQKKWPANRTINLVFHGHSVPAGFFKTPVVNTLGAYPYQLLKELKTQYPYAVINIITTSIGGEKSISGEKRFDQEVMVHRPDVLFIDYALNDRGAGLEKAKNAWESMVTTALEEGIKVILLTPSPDQRVDILDETSILDQHSNQIKELAKKHVIGLVDSYSLFREKVQNGHNITDYMSQVNHPNEKGHRLIVDGIMKYFD